MNQKFISWVEDYLFFPNLLQKLLSVLFIPLTLIYMIIISFKRLSAKKVRFKIPIISIGNIIVGGSGKTPIAIEIAKQYDNVAIILRGYGRASKGLNVIQHNNKILTDVSVSGDEAMLLATSLPNATIIVSENRIEAIEKAYSLGVKIVLLDDGFSKYQIDKFDILLRPKIEPTNIFCLPSGGYREPKIMYATADMVLKEDEDFKRVVSFKQNGMILEILPQKVVLLTAISKPKRLLEFLPKNIEMVAFADHYTFSKIDIDVIQGNYKDFKIITTGKDLVKLKEFNIEDLILMDLNIEISKDMFLMKNYINSFEK